MECILVFIIFFWGGAGRRCLAHSAGVRGERKEGSSRPKCWLEEETDPGETLEPSFFSSLPVTSLNRENSKCATECHTLGDTFWCPTVSPTWARAAHDRWIQPRPPRFLFPAHIFLSLPVTLFIVPSLPHICLLPFSLSFLSSLPCSFDLLQKENHSKGAVLGEGFSLAVCISVVAIIEVETLLAIPRSSVSSNR